MRRVTNRSRCGNGLVFGALAGQSRRWETTGSHHQYEPGPFAKAARSIFAALTPAAAKKKVAMRMQAGLEKVEVMEKEAAWIRAHGSPLRVLDLPEHATLAEVKYRYTDMILDSHPDTKKKTDDEESEAGSSGAQASPSTTALQRLTKAPERPSFELIREAHAMIMNPNSVYHLNRTNPELLAEVQLYTGKKEMSPAKKFGIFSYVLAGLFAAFMSVVGFAVIWESLLKAYDPEFYEKMIAKEKDEAARRAAGEEVDVNPKRIAPKQLQKLYYPGRFLHPEEDEENEAQATE